jgi:hypothetical protein
MQNHFVFDGNYCGNRPKVFPRSRQFLDLPDKASDDLEVVLPAAPVSRDV